jgi:nucleoside-diphosphate-sugar epimerase
MASKRVFITGITGFLGSHLGAAFVKDGYEVIGLKRSTSDTWRCDEYQQRVFWVNVDTANWKAEVVEKNPSIIIHGAWDGVTATDRHDLRTQMTNLTLLTDVLDVTAKTRAAKFVGLGSQAEYGLFDGIIDESFPAQPNSAYGLSKLLSMETVKFVCTAESITWYWLRLFPCFGEGESLSWFIPMLAKNLATGKPMDMTAGHQQYAYLYVRDEVNWIKRLAESKAGSGIFNISSKNLIALKDLVIKVKDLIKPMNDNVKLGALPYRQNQPMILGGKTSKLAAAIGTLEESSFADNLKNTVDFMFANSNHY